MSLLSSIIQHEGKGSIYFGQKKLDVNFTINATQNTLIHGKLFFSQYSDFIENSYDSGEKFDLHGTSTNGEVIYCYNCVLTRLNTNITMKDFPPSVENTNVSRSAEFYITIMVIDRTYHGVETDLELILEFSLINMYRLPSLNIDTEYGKIILNQDKNITQLSRLMRFNRLPLVTSTIEIHLKKSIASNVVDRHKHKLLYTFERIISKLLKILSLCYGSWVDWYSMSLLYKNSLQMISLQKIQRSRNSIIPSYSPLDQMDMIKDIVTNGFEKYNSHIEEKYGFGLALEWYIASLTSIKMETKYINAMTCFEMILDSYHSFQNTSFILEDETLKNELVNTLKKEIRSKFSSRLNTHQRELIYANLLGLNRRTFLDKSYSLMENLGVKHTELASFPQIKAIRDQITHTGRYKNPEVESELLVSKNYKLLIKILRSMFVSMLIRDAKDTQLNNKS